MSESLPILLSVIALAVSLIAIFYAYRRHIQERKPLLIFDEKLDPKNRVTLSTMIINIGKGPALNIRPASWLPAESPLWELPLITRNLACTDETQRKTIFVSGPKRQITHETFWEIHYDDLDGRSYRTVLRGTKHRFERIR